MTAALGRKRAVQLSSWHFERDAAGALHSLVEASRLASRYYDPPPSVPADRRIQQAVLCFSRSAAQQPQGFGKEIGSPEKRRASAGGRATERWAASTRWRGTRRCWLDCLIDAIPMSSFAPVTGVDEIPCWSSINETSEAVRISKARLRSLQAAGKLK